MLHQTFELNNKFPDLLLQQQIALILLIATNRKGNKNILGRYPNRLSPAKREEELSELVLFLLDELEVYEVVGVRKGVRRNGEDEGILGGPDEGNVGVKSAGGKFADCIQMKVGVLLAH